MKQPRTFWDTFEGFYQMGDTKHRIYALDYMKSLGIKSLLDVGCGTGPIYDIIKRHNYPFYYKGTDFAEGMIEVCKREFPEGNWEVEDMRHLTEPDNSWDCVLLMHSLDHTDDYKKAIQEATRVSKKYVCIILWRALTDKGTNLNANPNYMKPEGNWDEPTFLQEYSLESLYEEFKINRLVAVHIAPRDEINEERGDNFLIMLEKI
jgi:ubiquinone/menaquinone biosynthesis C-methylase UbiE